MIEVLRGEQSLDDDDLLTCGEVAAMVRVDPKTVTRWTKEGRLLPAVVTPGGHRRYRYAVVRTMLRDDHATKDGGR